LYEFDPELKVASDYFKKFNGVEHRLEYVRTLNGVIYYNDSKATNPVATIQALKTFKEPIRLILGGMERYQDFNDLNDYMKGVTKIYAIGTVTDRVYDYALSQKIDCTKCTTLDKALESIKKDVNKGDVVLLSTASSSQDQYARFEDRGDEFKRIVNSY
jgi:UDP-N-acetylmuramoylalanine--D-glutamate ligase